LCSYAETYCFIKNTYNLPLYSRIPDTYQERTALEIGYYQWVPLVLVAQALLFFAPSIIWRIFYKRTGTIIILLNPQFTLIPAGINIKSILKDAAEVRKTVRDDKRTAGAKKAAEHIDEVLHMKQSMLTVREHNRPLATKCIGHFNEFVELR
jgi:hypothetical protein